MLTPGISGPRTVELAGEIADGVILSLGTSPEIPQSALEAVEVGLTRSGRTLDDFDVACTYFMHLTDDLERDLDFLRPTVCSLAANTAGKRPYCSRRRSLPRGATRFRTGRSAPEASRQSDSRRIAGEPARCVGEAVPDEMALRVAAIGGLFGCAEDFARGLGDVTAAGATRHWALGGDTHRLPSAEIDALSAIRSMPALATR